MSASSSRASTQAQRHVPQSLDGVHRFGNGYRFEYSRQKSDYGFSQSAHEEQPIHEESARQIAMPRPANDETGLPPYDRLAFASEVSIRYHNRRKQHYDNVFRGMMLGVIVFALIGAFSGLSVSVWTVLGVIGLAAGTLVWNVTQKSREHDVLRSEYQNLFEQIRMTPEPTENDIRIWRNLRLRIQTKEPPVYWAVANECYYDVARAWDLSPKKRPQPPAMLRFFVNWFRF